MNKKDKLILAELLGLDIELITDNLSVGGYLDLDPKAMKVTYVRVPSFDEVPYPVTMEPNLVVEFYSR